MEFGPRGVIRTLRMVWRLIRKSYLHSYVLKGNKMKIAFHFDADYEPFDGYYGWPIKEHLFKVLLSARKLDIHTKIFCGDLLLHSWTVDVEKTPDGIVKRFNKDKFFLAVEHWLRPENPVWHSFTEESIRKVLNHNVYVLCFESLRFSEGRNIDHILSKQPYYLGAMQVDEESPVHWIAYGGSLIASYRLHNKKLNVFWDGLSEDSVDQGEIDAFRNLGFESVEAESLNGKFTIFDKYDNFNHARRIAELNRVLSDSLAFVVDHVVSRLTDSAPELGNKLWSAINTFERGEVSEDYAQVAASCRRVIEYVSDQLFPATVKEDTGKKLGKSNYRNRLLAFADKERKSNTNIDLICVATNSLSGQLEKLGDLVNKGVHAEVMRHEARRCLIRTILILDDIISLKQDAFEIKAHLNEDLLQEMLSKLTHEET